MSLELIQDWAVAAAPPPMLTVSQWADANRFLPQASGARGGRWRTHRTPYLRGIMDAVHEPGVQQIALRKAAQVGGSEALHNIIGFHIEHDPCPMLMVHPSDSVAEEWSKERLADMLRSTPTLDAVVRTRRQRRAAHQGESTLDFKMFPGGFLALGGANTPNTFARRAARIAMGDDVDRWPAVVGGSDREEGDPADLLINRVETFDDGLVIWVSTPTLKHGRIDTLFERGDRRQYHVRCPSCGREDWITWSDAAHFRVVWTENDPETARLACPDDELGGCGARLDEPTRRRMVADGIWKPTAVAQDPGLVSFHLPAMVTTLGQASLSRWASRWLTAVAKGKESTRVFINTTLAEGWEDRTAKMDPQTLYGRREPYGDGIEVPMRAVCLTAGVDVQENRFELQVTGWGFAGERWVVDVRRIPGDPKQHETRESLLEALTRKYAHATGHQLPILATCLDTGYATDEMYEFVLANQFRRIYATKGFAGRGGTPIVGKVSEKRSGRSGRPVPLYPINVDDAKADIMSSLALQVPPNATHGDGPNVMHFPIEHDSVNEEYFSQLTAERKETKYNKAKVATHIVWVKDRERNEALDMSVLCLAAFRLLNPNIRQMAEILASTPLPGATPPSSTPAPATPPPTARRVGRSSYLGGR